MEFAGKSGNASYRRSPSTGGLAKERVVVRSQSNMGEGRGNFVAKS